MAIFNFCKIEKNQSAIYWARQKKSSFSNNQRSGVLPWERFKEFFEEDSGCSISAIGISRVDGARKREDLIVIFESKDGLGGVV